MGWRWPSRTGIRLRSSGAVAASLAVERVEKQKTKLKLSSDQLEQLKERRSTESTAEESAFRQLYDAAWLPRVEGGTFGIETVEISGRPLKLTGSTSA